MSAQAAVQTQTAAKPSIAPVTGSVLQRQCACGQHANGGECAECRQKRRGTLQRAAVNAAPVNDAPPFMRDALRTPGQLLDPATRAFMEPRFRRDFSWIPAHSYVGGALQTKLAINKPGDEYEQEADRIAKQVMAAPGPMPAGNAPSRIQRYTGQPTGQMDTAPASVDRVLASSGRPLDPALRQDMEQRFGHDFSQVRVHSGAAAEQSARDVNAHAYTVGHDIVFGAGQFAPRMQEGRRLIAHELTHVVQQSGAERIRDGRSDNKHDLSAIPHFVQQRSGVHLKNNVGEPGDAYERHADAVTALVVLGRHAGPLLNQMVASGESHNADATGAGVMQKAAPAVQMQGKPKLTPAQEFTQAMDSPEMRESMARSLAIDKIKVPIIRALAKEYVNRPDRFESPGIFVENTPYGGDKMIGGFRGPTEDRVFWALKPVMDLKKTGKGDKTTDWSLRWADEPAGRKKTTDEKDMETLSFATHQMMSKTFDNPGLDLLAEYLETGNISGTSVVEAIAEPAAEWIMKNVLRVSAKVAFKFIPIIGWLWLVYDVADLLISLNAPAKKELSPYQAESADIVAGVKAYLEGKEKAAELKKDLEKPFNLPQYIEPFRKDATIVQRH